MPVNRPESQKVTHIFKHAGFTGRFALLLSSWFGSGLAPFAQGTFGTLAALPLVIIVNYLGPFYECAALAVIIPLGIWASRAGQKLLKKNDPSEVVIDEVAGMLLAVFLLPLSWPVFITGFMLFRFFDILKPFPVGMIDRKVRGGSGIVLDDVMAGIYANICIRLIRAFFL